ncbi:MAG: hypothetical protein ACYDEQ_15485, partial [Desulfocucumaceae bacterium]
MNIEAGSLQNKFPLINRFIFGFLLLALLVPPYFRGLYYRQDQWNYLMLIIPLFIFALMLSPGPGRGRFDALDCFMLALPLVYMVSAIRPASPFLAVNEALKYFAMFAVYWMVSRIP